MRHGKALVLKTYDDALLVLTAGGEFRRLKRRPPLPLPGEEIDLAPERAVRWLPLALAAAVFVAALLPLGALALRPAAYIALDINPSLGLTVGRNGLVKSGEALNDAGARLLAETAVVGQTPATAVEGLVRQAALDGYLADRPEDVVLVTRVDLKNGAPVALSDLEAAARRALEETEREAFVAVEEAAPSELVEARGSNVSLNKLRLVKKLTLAPPTGQERREAIAELRSEGIREILAQAGKRADEVYSGGRWQGKKKRTEPGPGGAAAATQPADPAGGRPEKAALKPDHPGKRKPPVTLTDPSIGTPASSAPGPGKKKELPVTPPAPGLEKKKELPAALPAPEGPPQREEETSPPVEGGNEKGLKDTASQKDAVKEDLPDAGGKKEESPGASDRPSGPKQGSAPGGGSGSKADGEQSGGKKG